MHKNIGKMGLRFSATLLLASIPIAVLADIAPGTQVQGNVFGKWETCTTVGPQQRFGGYILHCPSLNSDNIFSATDVKENAQAANPQEDPAPPQAQPRAQAQERPAPEMSRGRPVEGRIFGKWEPCTTVGKPQRFGGQILHCPSLPDDNIFSATDVREIGQAEAPPEDNRQPLAQAQVPAPAPAPAAPRGRQVKGNVFGTWETCTLVGKQQGAGGYILHCPSLPDDNIFSESDVQM